MADNFDSNVAARKPTVNRGSRPLRPWNVSPASDTDDQSAQPDSSGSDADVKAADAAASSDQDTAKERAPGETAPPKKKQRRDRKQPSRTTTEPVSETASDLSDSINIHSNFCKLDNGVSDYLLCRLSASAQSVYIRLYRQSFGWNRNWAAESLPKLSKACNLSLQTIRKAIKELESIGCIRKEFSDYHKATVYRIFLPSEIGIGKAAMSRSGGQISDTQDAGAPDSLSPESPVNAADPRIPMAAASDRGGGDSRRGPGQDSGGLESVIQSVYFSGSSIYALLESGGALPKNISTYITDRHLRDAVAIVDEFYDSIGFSVVSRSLYRKSILDYIDLVKSGFSPDDIRYSVRWTFKNSRSRPESFSLIKHTIHLAMKEMIDDLKRVSGQKDAVKRRQEAIEKSLEWEAEEPAARSVGEEDRKRWDGVVKVLEGELNDHSFRAFIEPLKLLAVGEGSVTLGAPPDFVSWIHDHYRDRIAECWRDAAGEDIDIIIE